jgi:DNA replication ATP-dependent helicase Dna2
MANYLNAGDNVNIIQGKSRDFEETRTVNVLDGGALGYIVLEPAILIDATKMASIAVKHNHFCFFKYHQRRMRIEKVVNYYVIKGNIVGGVFDEFLLDTDNFDFEDSFKKYIEKEKIKFIGIDYIPDLKNLKEDVRADLDNLINWYSKCGFNEYDKSLEPHFISPKFGLQGRMDILFKDKSGKGSVIIELKTGRSPEKKDEAWINHKFQIIAYNFIYNSVYGDDNPRSIILYAGSKDVSREFRFSNELKRDFIFLRNKIVFYEKLYTNFDYETMLSFRREIKDCHNCPDYLKKKCSDIFEIFDDLDDEQKSYYFSFYKMVEHERAVSIAKNSLVWSNQTDDEFSTNNRKKYLMDDLELVDFNGDEGMMTLQFNDNPSEIREGDSVVLHTGDPEKEELFRGEVVRLYENRVKVRLRNNYVKDFNKKIKWTLNRFTYLTGAVSMLDGLFRFAQSKKRFKDLIMLKKNPEFDSINIIQSGHDEFDLNPAQSSAVDKSICSRDYFLLQGPPGTGKTKTIAFIINELVRKKQRVILSALTNKAVDNVLLRLIEDHGFKDFIRIGNPASVDEKLRDHLLQMKAAKYSAKEMKALKKEIKGIPLVAATTTSAAVSFIFDRLKFDAAVIDEASQIPEPSVFSVITRADKFIMVGDLYQLGPVVRSEYNVSDDENLIIGAGGLKKTLFERLWEHSVSRDDIEDDNNPCEILDVQYRMNKEIIKFSNMKFYGGVLKTDKSVLNSKIKIKKENELYPVLNPEIPVVFIDVPGRNTDRENKKEARLVKEIIRCLADDGIKCPDIGVISPFKAQCARIRRMIEPYNKGGGVLVDTVERFQGSERDVIITSFVVGDANGMDFLRENDAMNKKLNVTITRACKKLILIGNKKVLSGDTVYKELVDFIANDEKLKLVSAGDIA